MKTYKSNREVQACLIKSIEGRTITPARKADKPFDVSDAFIATHLPKAGGYFVVHADSSQEFVAARLFDELYGKA